MLSNCKENTSLYAKAVKVSHPKHCGPKIAYLTTISVGLRFLSDFELLSVKNCSLYHEKLFIQEFKDISSQVLNKKISASDVMEAVRGHFCFYGMNGI